MCNKKRMAAHIVFIKATENCYSIVEDRKDNLNRKEKNTDERKGCYFFSVNFTDDRYILKDRGDKTTKEKESNNLKVECSHVRVLGTTKARKKI